MARVVELLGGRYEIEELIGAGGMGEVFRARDLRLERTVAVKRPSEAFTGSARERFRREAQSAARLNHPHVVTVYDWGDEGDDAYLVMEHVEGRSLRALLHEHGTLAPTDVARVGAQIADALAHAHAKGVIHRDVKPSNVLLTTVGTVKVTDFGIAQSGIGEAITDPGVVIGTAGYLAPEQVAGQRADPRSDIYSLGVLLTELLTGSREAGGVDDGDRAGTAVEPAGLAELRRVIRRARALDRQHRYARATELRAALRTCARDTDGLPAVDPALASSSPRTAAVVDLPTATVAALTGTVADPTKVLAAPVAAPATAPVAVPVAVPVVAPVAVPVAVPVALPTRVPEPARAVAPVPSATPVPSPAPAFDATRRWRVPHVLWLVAAPVTLALAAAGVLAYRAITTPPETTVPAVVGNDLFTSAGAIERVGLEYRLVEVRSPQPGGIVLAVRPRAGRSVHEGDTVALRYASGYAFMPDVIGMNEADATAALRDVGLVNVAPVDDFTDDAAPGAVTATDPLAHRVATKSDSVRLSIARDPSVVIPIVVRLDEATARAALEQRGLVVVSQAVSSRAVPAGQVVSVTPGEGAGATRGDTVLLRVSSGPKLVTVAYVVSERWADAYDDLRDQGFVVEVRSAAAAKKDDGRVIDQTPAGGQAPEGSTVTITVGRS